MDQIRVVLYKELTETTEGSYGIYLLLPSENPEACQSYLRMKNRTIGLDVFDQFDLVVTESVIHWVFDAMHDRYVIPGTPLIVAINCHAAETTNDASPAAAITTTVALPSKLEDYLEYVLLVMQ